MAKCPFAEWRGPVPGKTPGGMGNVVGAVFHIMGASMAASDGWFHNPSSKVSAHFGIGMDGHLVQWVDTTDKAWHAGAANSHWIGVETEGVSGPLSDAGIATFAKLYAWLNEQYGVPFGITDDPDNGHGLGWHGMGGASWGGHDYCPGPERRAQRAQVIRLAQGDNDMTADEHQMLVNCQTALDIFNKEGLIQRVKNIEAALARAEDAASNTPVEQKLDAILAKLK